MNTISQIELMNLVETSGDRFVSIYMPTYPSGREMSQNPIRFKVLLSKAADTLRERGMSSSDLSDLLTPAEELHDQPLFWKSQGHGLAVFVSRKGMHFWQLPFESEALCVVGKRFHITPLVDWLKADAAYYVLAVSQNRTRLLRGGRCKLQEIWVPDMPASLEASLHYDRREGLYQFHSGQPQIRGKEGLVFTGQGGEVDVAKEEIGAFFRMVDAAIARFMQTRHEPLVFAGVDYLYPIYREHNHYPHLVTQHISGNPDLLSPEGLCQRAWPLIESFVQERQAAEIAKYWKLVEHGRSSNRLEDIVRASHAGVVETLFISPTVRRLGAFDPIENAVRLDDSPRHDSEDLVNLAACFVLKHRGNVESVSSGNIPGGGPMAAVFRYELTAALAEHPHAVGELI